MGKWSKILLVIVAIVAYNTAMVAQNKEIKKVVVENKVKIVGDSLANDSINPLILNQLGGLDDKDINNQKVIVGKDTVDIIIPERNFGRYDRGLFNYLIIPKGQWAIGLQASYGELNTDDVQVLSLFKDLNLKGKYYTIRPMFSYFFKNNECVGMSLAYSRKLFNLGSLSVDIDDDMKFNLKDVDYGSDVYSVSLFYRHYLGLDKSKRFAIFNEVEAAFNSGNGHFLRYYNEQPRNTKTTSTEARLNFSPGLCVFMQDYVSFNISFGVFGLYWKKEKQTTNDEETGSRSSSGANFKFNLFNLNMGIAVHI